MARSLGAKGRHRDQKVDGEYSIRVFSWEPTEEEVEKWKAISPDAKPSTFLEVVDPDEDGDDTPPRVLLPATRAGVDAALAMLRADILQILDLD